MVSHSLDVLTRLPAVVPPSIAARAAAWTAGDAPVPAALSATVVLLRSGHAGLETYLLHRHARMPFAPSMVVFPGGRVDAADGAIEPLRRCAVRETVEETGVVIEETALLPWAHWVTPEMEPRRFDTTFYVAELPAGQTARDISGETDRAEWSTPGSALVASADGLIGLMPPTRSVLLELAELRTWTEVASAADGRVVERVLPQVRATTDGWRFVYPEREPAS